VTEDNKEQASEPESTAPEAENPPSGPSPLEPFDSEASTEEDLGSPPSGPEETSNLEDDAAERPTLELVPNEAAGEVSRSHLKGMLEALIFVSDHPVKANDLAKTAAASSKLVRELLVELKADYGTRGIQLDEVAGAWIFRSNLAYAPFVRDLAKQKPVRLSRAQVETLAILAYRQPITRPEIDDIRGVDCGPVLKLLLERDLVRILGRKDEPGRPMLYGTTSAFLEFFGLKSLKDLPTLREFTELSEDSRRVVERELGDVLDGSQPSPAVAIPAAEVANPELASEGVRGGDVLDTEVVDEQP
jgi:segregation and condensation protein B